MYTKGKWKVYNGIDIFPDDGDFTGSRHIADCSPMGYEDGVIISCEEMKANAERICLCVNSHNKLKKDRDDLLDALKLVLTVALHEIPNYEQSMSCEMADKAIAKAEGKD